MPRSRLHDGPTPERKAAALAVFHQIVAVVEPAISTFPLDPLDRLDMPPDRGEEIGRIIGLALTQGGRGRRAGETTIDANPFSVLRGLGVSYGEFTRGGTPLSVEVTEEYFTDGVAHGLAGMVSDDGDRPTLSGNDAEDELEKLVVSGLRTFFDDLLIAASYDGFAADDCARVFTQALLTIGALFSPVSGYDKGGLHRHLNRAIARASAINAQ